jgi:hypothetical protein
MATIESLVVEVRTDADPAAGTDDQVYFDIGTRQWRLDRVGRNDFQPGATDTFDLVLNSALDISDIRKIGLTKNGWNFTEGQSGSGSTRAAMPTRPPGWCGKLPTSRHGSRTGRWSCGTLW